ncbi:MAG: HNH endonuclease signature motif containing protein [Chloroflexota bacterium]
MAGVPRKLKETVWKKYMGNKQEGKCYCCNITTIDTFTFEAGHVISTKNNGPTTVDNLRPICRSCNSSMSTQNLEVFRAAHFPSSKGKLTTAKKIDKPKTERKLASKEYLSKLTVKQLKYLTKKHGITPSATVSTDLIWGNI